MDICWRFPLILDIGAFSEPTTFFAKHQVQKVDGNYELIENTITGGEGFWRVCSEISEDLSWFKDRKICCGNAKELIIKMFWALLWLKDFQGFIAWLDVVR